jgi:hypothetical protein
MAEQYLLFLCFMVSKSGGVERFVPMVMAVDRDMCVCVLGLLQILVLYSQFCYIILCVS